MIEFIVMIILGIILIITGIINISGNISTIHWYNRKNVTDDNQKSYGKLIGFGTSSIGISLVVTGILQLLYYKEFWFYIILIGIILGVFLILYSQFKYNKGIF